MNSDSDQTHLQTVDRWAIAFWFAALAATVYVASGWVIPFVGWADFDNIYFQADVALVYANMTEFDSNHYRTGMHPLFSIVMWPLGALIRMIADVPPSVVVRLLLSLNAGTSAALAFVVLRRVTATRIDAMLFTMLFCVSASTVFWLTVPETFAFGGTTILLMLTLASTVARPKTSMLVLGNIATMSMTLTNWMVGVYSTVRLLWPRWKHSLYVLVAAGCAVIVLGVASKLIIPSSGYVGDFRRYISWIRAPQASDFRSFFVHSMVMPAPVFRERSDGALEVVNEISPAGNAGVAGIAGVAFWLALLALGTFYALSGRGGSRVLRDVLLLSLASQLLLHVTFADGPFLYAAHFAPLLVVVAAYASRVRWSRALVAASIAALSINNLTVFGDMTDRFAKDLQPWLERNGKPMAKSAGHSASRTANAGR